ncbi:MAG: MFS transporter [Brevibacterium sp.]|uniref:MFS transporter n=1 Tax=Brevibacterium sp. TaxID=1701 RepID=UPI0026492F98|nr:MFS transporter [Brevibacterium sp.]MDN5806113.1 MFS transporter [Brevibacterium sp.]MDN5832621.1 MFS transporter [Brevibacterium sp.]MDN5875517.1 MFS transporter [Brevibacterium sp.]MDN5908445.1 MFS transporter [Brevibacterium sp.]MDN6156862.1 MFS transporter [Brevibacterium sp.]
MSTRQPAADHRAGERVGPLWMVWFTLAWLAIWTVQLTPVQLLLPLQLDTQSGDWLRGVVWSGVVLSAGGLAGILAAPIAGSLSDRTRSRWGRRRPWAIGGSLGAAVGLLLTGWAQGPLFVGAAWIIVSVSVAIASAALTALIADQLGSQRGTASAAASSAQAVGIVVGVGAVVLLGLGLGASYVLLAGIITVVGVGTALLLPDPAPVLPRVAALHTERAPIPRAQISSLLDHSFRWLLVSRFVVNVGNAFGTSLLLFFLLYGIGVPADTAEDKLLVLIVIYTVFVVIASITLGTISDRSGNRRFWTFASALVQACSGVLILISPEFVTTAIAAAIMGTGYGAYMAVSLAFATDLLLDPDDHARDLSMVNNSAALGQLVGPLLGAGLVALVGGFWLLFGAAALVSVVGALMTLTVHPRTRTST